MHRQRNSREVSPLGLVAKGTAWYLVAGTADGVRTLGAWASIGGRNPKGQVEVEITGPTVPFLVAEPAGLGRRLELVDPPEARAGLRALAEELGRRYADGR